MLMLFISVPAQASDSPKTTDKHELVVLIHGLMRTPLSMVPLKLFLTKHGYEAYNYGYISARYSVHDHSQLLKQYIEQLIANNPGKKINFVTHSMGGIMVREAVSDLPNNEFKQIGKLVMMAPPNQGSKLAQFSNKYFPIFNYFVKPIPELSADQQAYVHQVPIPKIKMGIIAGRYDLKVQPSDAPLPGHADMVVVNATHTFIMIKPKVMHLAFRFLQTGAFG